ncbi:MAG TPA: hypothetical protein VIG74_01515 [Alphaproteobacteria bacterium]
MGLLNDQERNEFRISISSKPVEKLNDLFNELTTQRNSPELDDNSRGKAAEKAAMVGWEIQVRTLGGSSG